MPKAIFFDLDGTLWDRTAAVRALLATQRQEREDVLADIPPHEYVERFIQLDANGTVSREVVYQRLGVEFGLAERLVNDLCADFWSRYEWSFQAFPEAMDTLRELRRIGLRLGIITNGSIRIQEQKISRLGLADLMDAVLISEREGIRKPDAEIFHRALARVGVSPSDGWFVGDNPDIDVAGAAAAGLRAFWRENSEWPRPAVPCETIQTLGELLPLLSQASQQPH